MIPYRNDIIHSDQPSAYPSPYQITDAALSNYNVSRELFGTTTVISADRTYLVHDYHYDVSRFTGDINPRAGMFFLPVNDYGDVIDTDGSRKSGYAIVDSFLRKEMGLSDSDQIFALISYMHPELNKGTIAQLASSDKAQLGFTHMGAYQGKNMTTNSPEFYHNCRWLVTGLWYTKYGYPANIHVVSLKNVAQKNLNTNMFLVDMMLNHGVQFPGDYANSAFKPVYLNAALMFYRDWLNGEDYLRKDPEWFMYCAAHKTVVVNVALNLPHNEAAFMEVFGADEGKSLFVTFKEKYRNATGFLFPDDLITDFVPLWKQEGLTPGQIAPFTIDQYNAYDTHRRDVSPYYGPLPVWQPKGVAWGPQTTADVLYDFVQLYADLLDAGAVTTCAVLYEFMPEIIQRTGIPAEEYLFFAMPIMEKLMYADARTSAATYPVPRWQDSAYYAAAFKQLCVVFGGTSIEKLPSREEFSFKGSLQEFSAGNPTPEQFADWALTNVRNSWDAIMKEGCVPPTDAYVEFMIAAQSDIEKAREMIVTDPDKIEFNTIPAIVEMISLGVFPKHDLVTVRTVCTALDMSELELTR